MRKLVVTSVIAIIALAGCTQTNQPNGVAVRGKVRPPGEQIGPPPTRVEAVGLGARLGPRLLVPMSAEHNRPSERHVASVSR